MILTLLKLLFSAVLVKEVPLVSMMTAYLIGMIITAHHGTRTTLRIVDTMILTLLKLLFSAVLVKEVPLVSMMTAYLIGMIITAHHGTSTTLRIVDTMILIVLKLLFSVVFVKEVVAGVPGESVVQLAGEEPEQELVQTPPQPLEELIVWDLLVRSVTQMAVLLQDAVSPACITKMARAPHGHPSPGTTASDGV